MKIRINFSEDELEQALADYFKIKKDNITFWYVSSLTKKEFILEYIK
jgi:hypothetical protein